MRLKFVVRRLAQLPAFTAVAILTLAIGIGANAAIFSVVEGVLLKPLPYPHQDELVTVDASAPGLNLTDIGAAAFLYLTYRQEARSFQDVGLWTSESVSVTGLAIPEEVRAVLVTDGVLPILGVRPLAGRLFTAADDRPGSDETAILAGGFWRSHFGGDPAAVGRRIVLDGRAREIIGVLPDDFSFLNEKAELFLPKRIDPAKTMLGDFSDAALGRLKPGVTIEQAIADLKRLVPLALGRFPAPPGYSRKMFEDARLTPDLRPLKQQVVGDIGSVLWVLMGCIGFVLLIACANVASLLLVRAEARQQELAIRAAIGAGWGEIARELLAESLVLAALGGAAGLALAYGGLRVLVTAAPANLPRVENIAIDVPVLTFAVVISLVAGLVFGAIPVLRYAGPQLAVALRGGGRTASHSRERHRARSTLVVVQVALALVLLICAGLMIRTFQALRRVDTGVVRMAEIQTFRISISESQVADGVAAVRMEQSILERIAAVPGVSSAGISSIVPLVNQGWNDPIFAEDHVYAPSQIPTIRRFKFISPGLLATMGNRLIAGRDFTWEDTFEKRPVAMVSENMARELWGVPSAAIGKRIREALDAPWHEVVAVVSDERDAGLDKPAPTVAFFPLLLSYFEGRTPFVFRSPVYMVRSSRTGTDGFVQELSRAVWSVNPSLPVANVRTLEAVASASRARTAFTLVMLAIAGAMALLLGFTGIYGVISYSVSQRTREIGIRVALGAQYREVIGMFVAHGVRLALVGVVCGVAGALVLTRLMRSLLFETSPVDLFTFVSVALSLIAAAALASYVPALRASSVTPVDALRAD